jgi:hypothetical protein
MRVAHYAAYGKAVYAARAIVMNEWLVVVAVLRCFAETNGGVCSKRLALPHDCHGRSKSPGRVRSFSCSLLEDAPTSSAFVHLTAAKPGSEHRPTRTPARRVAWFSLLL